MEKINDIRDYLASSLKERGIIIPEEYKDVFENHVTVLSERISKNECVDIDVTDMVSQLKEDSIRTAEEILGPLYKQFNVKESQTENALFALYIDLAKGGGI